MTSCDYCENEASSICDNCDAWMCQQHMSDPVGVHRALLCDPDPATWPGRGCYRPPVYETNDRK